MKGLTKGNLISCFKVKRMQFIGQSRCIKLEYELKALMHRLKQHVSFLTIFLLSRNASLALLYYTNVLKN